MECETSPYANLIPGTLGKADCQCFDTIVSNLSIIHEQLEPWEWGYSKVKLRYIVELKRLKILSRDPVYEHGYYHDY